MRKTTRSKKVNEGRTLSVKEKFLIDQDGVPDTEGMQAQKSPGLEAANDNQRLFLKYLREGRKVCIAQGSAGTGKSMLAAYHAANLKRSKKIERVVLVRANVSTGKSLGMLPGTLEEKLAPFFAQTITHLETFLGKSHVAYCLRKGDIKMQSIEHARGLSIENSLVIVEESQGLTSDEFEMLLTRIGEGTQMVFTGDQRQSDLKGVHGLTSTIKLIDDVLRDQPEYMSDDELECLDKDVGIVTFTPEDVVRSGLCKAFVKLYYYK